jgi:hypothetical protein
MEGSLGDDQSWGSAQQACGTIERKCDVRGRTIVNSFVDASMCLHLMIRLDWRLHNETFSWVNVREMVIVDRIVSCTCWVIAISFPTL